VRDAVRRTTDGLEAQPDLASVARRARVLRARRTLGGIMVAGVLAAAVAIPLWALTPIGDPPSRQPADESRERAPRGIFFPTLTDPSGGGPDALIQGTLEERNGCIRMGETLMLWPYGWSLEERDGRLTILDDQGSAAFGVGDRIWIGGGDVSGGNIAHPEYAIGEPIPRRCRSDGYWYARPAYEVMEVLAEGRDLGTEWTLLAVPQGPIYQCIVLEAPSSQIARGHRTDRTMCGPWGREDAMALTRIPVVRGDGSRDGFLFGPAPWETERVTASLRDGRTIDGRLFRPRETADLVEDQDVLKNRPAPRPTDCRTRWAPQN
jgi:hypothetical protein